MDAPAPDAIDRRTIAVVSPFLDKKHGTELSISELVERLSGEYGYDVHVYSQSIQDVSNIKPWIGSKNGNGASNETGSLVWHKVPQLPGPHLINFLWWIGANHLCRWWDRAVRGFHPDLVFS